ncbi:hypothetical protein HYC85_000446 [Camellia sinensis]|uniref:Uncharacterized protein n=1 Tax=Camellia sinensis TaxID=4442 RepID=A0A7J7I3N9_CAMSI|nr:hypothetical protein HYC85_000446 [Camellia sinensis]
MKMKMKLNKFMYREQYEFLQKTLKNDELKLDEEKVEKETDGKIKEEEELVVKEKDEEKNEEEKPDEKKIVEENEKKKKDEFYSSSMESLSKVMIVQGIGDMSLKSLATLLSVTDKSPKEASLGIIKSMTGIDAKEQMREVTRIKSFIQAMDENMNGKLDSLIKKIDVMYGKVHKITEKMDAIAGKLHNITEKIDGKLDGNLTQKMDAIDRRSAGPRHGPTRP